MDLREQRSAPTLLRGKADDLEVDLLAPYILDAPAGCWIDLGLGTQAAGLVAPCTRLRGCDAGYDGMDFVDWGCWLPKAAGEKADRP